MSIRRLTLACVSLLCSTWIIHPTPATAVTATLPGGIPWSQKQITVSRAMICDGWGTDVTLYAWNGVYWQYAGSNSKVDKNPDGDPYDIDPRFTYITSTECPDGTTARSYDFDLTVNEKAVDDAYGNRCVVMMSHVDGIDPDVMCADVHPEYEPCYVKVSQTTWDLGDITEESLRNLGLPFEAWTECPYPEEAASSQAVYVTATSNTQQGYKLNLRRGTPPNGYVIDGGNMMYIKQGDREPLYISSEKVGTTSGGNANWSLVMTVDYH